MIQNPNPITPQTFSGMWITSLSIFLPAAERPKGFITAHFLPFDGQNLLATGGKRYFGNDLAAKRTTDPVLDSMLASLEDECKRQAGKTSAVKFVTVQAPDPVKPVMAQIAFVDGTFHRIPDCFVTCGTDATFAGVFATAMGVIAELAGLTVA
jgi:hypothetical protein